MKPPISLPGYDVDRVVGRGGQGIVLGGRDRNGALVAIKIVDGKSHRETLERFRREKRLLSLLGERDGFVPILDAGESSAGPFFVMPFVAGGTLRERLERGKLPVAETVSLGIALSRALGRAHERGIVHRDFKPENVLFSREGSGIGDLGRPLVADLGLAKHWSRDFVGGGESIALSKSGEARGTFGYMASEQIQDSSRSGPASDVFSLGCVLYECLTGTGAWGGATPIEVVAKIESHELVPLERARPDTPPWLIEIVNRSLAHDPEDRFEDGESLALALEARGARSRHDSVWGRGLGRSALFVLAGVALTALAVAGGLALRARLRRAESERIAAAALEKLAHQGTVSRAEVDRAIELSPGCALAWTARSWQRVSAGDSAGAMADATHAIGLDPGLVRAWILRAWMHETDPPDWKAAVADLDHAVALDPGSADAFSARCSARSALHDMPGAYKDACRALELDPGRAGMWSSRAAFDAVLGKRDDQLSDSARALELDPSLPEAWINHAAALIHKHDYKGAEADLTHAIRLRPDQVEALANRSYVRDLLGDVDGAIADQTSALVHSPERAASFVDRGALYLGRKDWPRALADATRGVELDPTRGKGWALLAKVRLQLGDLDGANVAATRALEVSPGTLSALATRAVVRLRKGDDAGALADANQALELDARDLQTRIIRAFICDRSEDWKGSVRDYEVLAQRQDSNPDVWSNLGWARAHLDDLAGAEAALSRALEIAPGHATSLARRAGLREQTGDRTGARADFQRFLEIAPDDPIAPQVRETLRRLGGSEGPLPPPR